MLGGALYHLGRVCRLRLQHLEQGIALYDPGSNASRDHARMYGQDPGVTCLLYTSGVLCGFWAIRTRPEEEPRSACSGPGACSSL